MGRSSLREGVSSLRPRSDLPPTPKKEIHTHWLMSADEGRLEAFRGCCRKPLSCCSSFFRSHMSTDALWETCGASGKATDCLRLLPREWPAYNPMQASCVLHTFIGFAEGTKDARGRGDHRSLKHEGRLCLLGSTGHSPWGECGFCVPALGTSQPLASCLQDLLP